MDYTILKIGFIVFDVIVLMFLGLYLLFSYLKGWKKTILNIVAFLIPFIVYLIISDTILKMVMKIELPGIGSIYDFVLTKVQEAMGEDYKMQETTLELCQSVAISVLRFGTYYLALFVCLLIAQINRIIFHFAFKWFVYPGGDTKIKPNIISRLIGLGLGFVRFIFASVLLFFPIYGIINVAQVGLQDYAVIEELTKENSEETQVDVETFDYEELSKHLGTSISYKVFTLFKDKDTELALPAQYFGSILRVKTSSGTYNIIKEYGKVHVLLDIVSRMEINENTISFEKLTEKDVKTLHNTIGKTKLLEFLAPVIKESVVNELEQKGEEEDLINAVKNINPSHEAKVILGALNESFDVLPGLTINLQHPEDVLLEEKLVNCSSNILNKLVQSTIVKTYLLPMLSDELLKAINDTTDQMKDVITPNNLELCIKTDVSELLKLYQALSKNNNLHNFIFNDGEFIIDTDAATKTIEDSIDKIFELSIVKGNEKRLIIFALAKADQDKITYDNLFGSLNPKWQEEGKIIGAIVKEFLSLPKDARDFEKFSIEMLIIKDQENNYVYDKIIKEVSKSELLRNVMVNLLNSFSNGEENNDFKEILGLLNIDSVKNVTSEQFYQELKGLLEILDVLVDTNVLKENAKLNFTDENVELLIDRVFSSIFVKGNEEKIINYLLNKTSINEELAKMNITIAFKNVNWDTEPDKLVEVFKAILQFGSIDELDFNKIISERNSETNPKIVRLFVALRDSGIFEPILFDLIDKTVSDLEYKDLTDLFNFQALRSVDKETFEKEINNLLELVDIIEETNIAGEGELNITDETVDELITKLFDSVITDGKEAGIVDYIITQFNIKQALTDMGITIDVYSDTINWDTEPDKLVEVFKAILKFGDIDKIEYDKIISKRRTNPDTKNNVTNLVKALDESQVFKPTLYTIVEKMIAESGYEVTITDSDKTKIQENGWDKEFDVLFDALDICDSKLSDTTDYDTVSGNTVSSIMTIACESVITSKIVGTILNEMLGEAYLNINPKNSDGSYKYDFTDQETLRKEAQNIGKLVDIKHALAAKDPGDAEIEIVVDAVKNLEKSSLVNDALKKVTDGEVTKDINNIDLENESQIIQNVYTEYKNNGNNFDPTTNPELQEKLENSDVAKYLLKKLNIVK